jgi:sodium-dependent phosphate transporter
MLTEYSPDVVWIVVFGYIVAFILAFGLGANDVSNSFGTSVGSKVLTVKQACSIATVAEIAGAILIGKY